MINHYVSISLSDDTLGNISYLYSSNTSFSLGYPCENKHKCTPYKLEISRGKYLFECWGSVGGIWRDQGKQSTPGYGGYTSGILYLYENTTFYVYIGNMGFFNAVQGYEDDINGWLGLPGGATDIRLKATTQWWDLDSLITRIMVAGGGGGSEWKASIGGNGGGIVGGESISGKTDIGDETHPDKCEGAHQDSGSECKNYTDKYANTYFITGHFGTAGFPPQKFDDPALYGGFGGGGYYGGTSYTYAYAGSGGSSFISGHPGCNSVEEDTTKIKHTHNSHHYSGYIFRETKTIPGHNIMPLPSNLEQGLHLKEGAFRITILYDTPVCTFQLQIDHFLHISSLFIFLSSSNT